MTIKILALAAVAVSLATQPAAAKVTWRGNMCITAISTQCPAGDWVPACYDLAFRPPNLSNNGQQTLFAFGDDKLRYGIRLASGTLFGPNYKAVTQSSITTSFFSPPNSSPNPPTMRLTTLTSPITETTPYIYLAGDLNNVDGTPNCKLTFRASAVLSPNN